MLIEFRVENHCSIRTEQALSMEVGRGGDESDPRPRKVEGHDTPLLPVVAIYGANASGKSNVLSAFDFMCDAVVQSHRQWDPEGIIPRLPFHWDGGPASDSLYETTLVLNDTKFQYGFVLGDDSVKEEWLYAWPTRNRVTYFERTLQKIDVGKQLNGSKTAVDAAVEFTRQNSLFLSVAIQNNFSQLAAIGKWFFEIGGVNLKKKRSDANYGWWPSKANWTPESQNNISKILRSADLGISDFRHKFHESTDSQTGGRQIELKFQFKHSENDEDSWLNLEEESKGTQTLFGLSFKLLGALNNGHIVLVDELEANLHPLIAQQLVGIFNNPKSNPKNAQLIFTTHDTNLLSPFLDDAQLRRDQIWFTEKDSNGATKLYPLTDFKPRKEENLERGYLQGRYGAIPFLGDLNKLAEPEDVASKS